MKYVYRYRWTFSSILKDVVCREFFLSNFIRRISDLLQPALYVQIIADATEMTRALVSGCRFFCFCVSVRSSVLHFFRMKVLQHSRCRSGFLVQEIRFKKMFICESSTHFFKRW